MFCFRENILLTVGFAKLLMAQKLAQFRGLCDKNNVSYQNIVMINKMPRGGEISLIKIPELLEKQVILNEL